jgi:hypothetical protein
MNYTQRQLWQHIASGENFVVEINTLTGIIQRAVGPLHPSEICVALHLGYFHSDEDLVNELNDSQDQYMLMERYYFLDRTDG